MTINWTFLDFKTSSIAVSCFAAVKGTLQQLQAVFELNQVHLVGSIAQYQPSSC